MEALAISRLGGFIQFKLAPSKFEKRRSWKEYVATLSMCAIFLI
jgi:hypothetical protein